MVVFRACVAAIAVIAIPISVLGAEGPSSTNSDYTTKKTCEINLPTGSRLGGVRRCRTAREREEAKAETKQVVDRIQMMKATICTPQRPC